MKFLKQCYQLLKNLFIKEQYIEIDLNSKLDDIFSSISIGDIIWAKRYHNDIEKEEIPLGHREGPFIVVAKNNDELICMGGTSSIPRDMSKYFLLNHQNHSLLKDGYYRFCDLKIVTKNEFIRKIDFLNNDELEPIFKGIKINRGNKQKLTFTLPLQVGDIVQRKNLNYLVLDIKDKVCVLPLKNQKINLNEVKKIDFSFIKYFDKEELNYKNILDNNILIFLLKNYKKYVEYLKNQKIAQRGSIILKNNTYYYIYGEESDNWLAFKMLKKKKEAYEILELFKKVYYTNYEDTKINKRDSFDVIALCKEVEIDFVKDSRKNYKAKQKLKLEQQKLEDIKVGKIVCNSNYKNKRYIVVCTHKKTIECLDINKIKKGIYDPILIKKEDALKSENNSIEGIIWLEQNPDFNLSKINDKLNEIFDLQNKYLNGELKEEKNEINKVLVKEIKEELEEIIEENKLIAQRGSLLFKDNTYYYVYGEEGQDFLVFTVIVDFKENYDKLAIDNKTYYTIYKDTTINKKDNFIVISNSNDKEIDNIKAQRKNYRKTNSLKLQKKNNHLQISSPSEIKVGTIVKNGLEGEEYIVKQIIGNLLGCESVMEQGNYKKRIIYFDIKNVIVSSYAKRK